MQREFKLLTAVIVVAGFMGCEGKGPGGEVLKTVPAGGTLTYNNQPLEGYTVYFNSSGDKRPAVGDTDAAGNFVLGTNQTGDGAPPGKYKVTAAFNPKSKLDPAVASPAEIAASMPKEKVKLPAKFSNAETSGVEIEVPAGGKTDIKIDLK